MEIDVIEIYPRDSTDKYLERGSVHIFVRDWNVDIKNIPYNITEEKTQNYHVYHVHVTYPHFHYSQDQKNGNSVKKIWVPTISFRDQKTWKEVKNVIRKAILSKFEKERLIEQ